MQRGQVAQASACDFGFGTNGKAHRLKSVLPKPASHRNAIQRIKLVPENKKRFRVREKCGLVVRGFLAVVEKILAFFAGFNDVFFVP